MSTLHQKHTHNDIMQWLYIVLQGYSWLTTSTSSPVTSLLDSGSRAMVQWLIVPKRFPVGVLFSVVFCDPVHGFLLCTLYSYYSLRASQLWLQSTSEDWLFLYADNLSRCKQGLAGAPPTRSWLDSKGHVFFTTKSPAHCGFDYPRHAHVIYIYKIHKTRYVSLDFDMTLL